MYIRCDDKGCLWLADGGDSGVPKHGSRLWAEVVSSQGRAGQYLGNLATWNWWKGFIICFSHVDHHVLCRKQRRTLQTVRNTRQLQNSLNCWKLRSWMNRIVWSLLPTLCSICGTFVLFRLFETDKCSAHKCYVLRQLKKIFAEAAWA